MEPLESSYPIVFNKVTSPRYVTPTLRRARLLDWLHESASCRAVVLAADAGYGKTTLLWQWEREAEFPCYWYKLDRADRDWSLHITYLVQAISQRHPGFGQKTTPGPCSSEALSSTTWRDPSPATTVRPWSAIPRTSDCGR